MKQSQFTEADTEAFYDNEDSLYKSFWDSQGSLHWGYFENLTELSAEDFIPACQHWNQYMLSQGGITQESRILDLGCGNGNTAIQLEQPYRCSPVQSANALAKVLPNQDATILDAGAGTGMVGEALAALGYTNIAGIDLSG